MNAHFITSINVLSNPILGLIEVTQKCNLNCPICFRRLKNQSESSMSKDLEFGDIIDRLERLKKERPDIDPTIALTGGEPTLRDDLPDLIARIHTMGFKRTEVMTNGIRLAEDVDYVKDLKKAGLSQMGLQFDGFNNSAYQLMRGKEMAETKRKALENLKSVNQATILAACIMQGINDGEIGSIIDYAVENKDFIEHVNFQSFIRNSNNSDKFDLNYISNKDEIVNSIECQTKRQIKMEHFTSPATILPVPEFIEAVSKKPQKQYFPLFHEDCNLTTYVYVTKNKTLIPVQEALNMDSFLKYLEKITIELNNTNSFGKKTLLMMKLTLNMLVLIKKRIFRKMLFSSVLKKEFDPLANLKEILMISCENYMGDHQFDYERNKKCGLFFLEAEDMIRPFCQQEQYKL